MTYLFIALALFFGGVISFFGFIAYAGIKNNVLFVILGWIIGFIGEVASAVYVIMWIASLFK